MKPIERQRLFKGLYSLVILHNDTELLMKYKILLEYPFNYPWHNFDDIIICKWFKRKKILEHKLWCYTCVNLFIACIAFGLYSKSFSFLQKETTRKVSVLTIQRKYGTYDNKPNKINCLVNLKNNVRNISLPLISSWNTN